MTAETCVSIYEMNTACMTLAQRADRSKDGAQVVELLRTQASLADYENEDGSQMRIGDKGTVSTIDAYRTTRYH